MKQNKLIFYLFSIVLLKIIAFLIAIVTAVFVIDYASSMMMADTGLAGKTVSILIILLGIVSVVGVDVICKKCINVASSLNEIEKKQNDTPNCSRSCYNHWSQCNTYARRRFKRVG